MEICRRDDAGIGRLIKCRWLLTVKSDGRRKARLVAIGFRDPNAANLVRESPTLTQTGEHLLLQAVAVHAWLLVGVDIRTAFLPGNFMDRCLAVVLPRDLEQSLGLDASQVIMLGKNVYGLVDAPRRLYLKLVEELERLHFKRCNLHPCLWRLAVPSSPSQLSGVLGVHVDDLIGGGDVHFRKQLKALE